MHLKLTLMGPSLLLEVGPLSAGTLNKDFKNAFEDPWYDSSPFTIHWIIEDLTSPTEIDYPPPTPLMGAKHLRAIHNAQLSAGLLILRTVTFTALPGDQISFNFWIRSKYTGGNLLELVLAIGVVETTLLTLSSYSTSVNFEWHPPSTISTPTDVTLVFYGYCSGNAENAIAIDDIIVGSADGSTTEEITTSMIATTTPAPGCPDYIGITDVGCQILAGKCYCTSIYYAFTWLQADEFCKEYGMKLVSIETKEEDKLIYDDAFSGGLNPQLKHYWTSGRYSEESSQYIWASQDPFQPFNYSNWKPGHPINRPDFCVTLEAASNFTSGYWTEHICTVVNHIICESIDTVAEDLI